MQEQDHGTGRTPEETLRDWAKAEVDKAPALTLEQVEAIRAIVSGQVLRPNVHARHRAS